MATTEQMDRPDRTVLDGSKPVTIEGPESVTYDFQSYSPAVVFIIPPGSSWESPPHWHKSQGACEGITVPSRSDHHGPRVLFKRSLIPQTVDARYLGRYEARYPPSEHVMRPLERVAWKPYFEKKHGNQGHPTEIILRTLDQHIAQDLYRNVAGVTLDAPKYPQLATTSILIRWFWKALRSIPFLQRRLEAALLGLQLVAIFHAHDFWTIYWTPKIGWLFWWRFWDGPPRWVPSMERKISDAFSFAVMTCLAFIATRILGMETSYEEYNRADKI